MNLNVILLYWYLLKLLFNLIKKQSLFLLVTNKSLIKKRWSLIIKKLKKGLWFGIKMIYFIVIGVHVMLIQKELKYGVRMAYSIEMGINPPSLGLMDHKNGIKM